MSTCNCFQGVAADRRAFFLAHAKFNRSCVLTATAAYTPQGSVSRLADLEIYTSSPLPGVAQRDETILFLPDGFGLARHNRLLADMYAQYGYETTIVDYFEGDALPDFFMLYTPGTDLGTYSNITSEQKDVIRKINMEDWGRRHNPERVAALVRRVFSAYCETVKENRQKKGLAPAKIHVVGHCFGGKHAFRLAKHNDGSVGSVVIFHPSFLEPDDLEDLKRPVLVGCAETDVFTPDLVPTMISKLPVSGTTWKLLVYGGTQHGFASRSDLGDKWVAKMFAQAFDDGIQWLQTMWPEK